MANNIYIGSRYVPIFADPVEWDSLRTYEPLTIVTYLGTSYTSRKAVPAGVQLSNTEYWVVTGNYNAQVSALTTEVNGLSTNVSNLNTRMITAESDISSLQYLSNSFKGKKILILGDSISDQTISFSSCLPNWVDKFENALNGVATLITNNSVSGRKMIDLPAVLNNIGSGTLANYDMFIIFLGINDFSNNVSLGDWQTNGTFNNAIRASFEAISNALTGSGKVPQIYFISPMYNDTNGVNSNGTPLYFYRASILEFCKRWNCYFINGDGIMYENELIDYLGSFYYDDTHPNSSFAEYMYDYFIRKIVSLGDKQGEWVGKNITLLNSYTTGNFSETYCKAFIDADHFLHVTGHGTLSNIQNVMTVLENVNFINTGYTEEGYGVCTLYDSSGVFTGIVFREGSSIKINMTQNAGTLPASGTLTFDLKLKPNWLYWDRRE